MSRFLRVTVPAAVIVAWLVVASIGGPTFGRISEVSTTDQTSFLPASADATRVQERSADFRPESGPPAVVVLERRDGALGAEDLSAARALSERLGDTAGVDAVSPPIPSDDAEAAEIVATLSADADAGDTVEAIHSDLDTGLPNGLRAYVTGPAGFTADLTEAFAGIDGILLGVALVAVLVILVVVYRSPVLPFLVLGTATFALTASILVVWALAKAEVVTVNGQVQGILSILVIGAATSSGMAIASSSPNVNSSCSATWPSATGRPAVRQTGRTSARRAGTGPGR